MENQLGTRNMVKAVTEEFWRMVQASIHDQTLKFKGALPAHTRTHTRTHTHTHTHTHTNTHTNTHTTHTHKHTHTHTHTHTHIVSCCPAALRYRLEAEWRNKFPGERVLDRSDLFEVERASLLREVASLVLIRPAQWSGGGKGAWLVGVYMWVCVYASVCAFCVWVCTN